MPPPSRAAGTRILVRGDGTDAETASATIRTAVTPPPAANQPRGMRRRRSQPRGEADLMRSLQEVSPANSAASTGEEHDLALLATRLYHHNAPVRGPELHLALDWTTAVEDRDARAARATHDGAPRHD